MIDAEVLAPKLCRSAETLNGEMSKGKHLSHGGTQSLLFLRAESRG